VSLKAPLKAFPIGVLAVDTKTASLMIISYNLELLIF
jgi:hypothetical protein